jgi:hypothetical protein
MERSREIRALIFSSAEGAEGAEGAESAESTKNAKSALVNSTLFKYALSSTQFPPHSTEIMANLYVQGPKYAPYEVEKSRRQRRQATPAGRKRAAYTYTRVGKKEGAVALL